MDCARAVSACRYFELDHLANVVEAIAHAPQDRVEQLYQPMWDAWDDGELTEAFKRRFAAFPGDFDPVPHSGAGDA